MAFTASYTARDKKLPYVLKAAAKLDTLKFFLQVSWEIKQLDTNKYAAISEPLSEVGRMLGGWIKQAEKQTPHRSGE